MREIVFDTETTGVEPGQGDRVVEIGAVELWNHLPTGRSFHRYIDPERPMPAEAFAIHGLGDDFLRGKPKFAEIAADWAEFVGTDARLIAHNAGFDIAFMNMELRRAGAALIDTRRVVDTLALARGKFPGAQNSLDALCRRFGVDNSGRDLHGALLDARLLAEVYLELIGGRQPDLVLEPAPRTGTSAPAQTATVSAPRGPRPPRPVPLPSRLTPAEAQAHAAFVARLGEGALWLRWQGSLTVAAEG